jgi:hypothetical protein
MRLLRIIVGAVVSIGVGVGIGYIYDNYCSQMSSSKQTSNDAVGSTPKQIINHSQTHSVINLQGQHVDSSIVNQITPNSDRISSIILSDSHKSDDTTATIYKTKKEPLAEAKYITTSSDLYNLNPYGDSVVSNIIATNATVVGETIVANKISTSNNFNAIGSHIQGDNIYAGGNATIEAVGQNGSFVSLSGARVKGKLNIVAKGPNSTAFANDVQAKGDINISASGYGAVSSANGARSDGSITCVSIGSDVDPALLAALHL